MSSIKFNYRFIFHDGRILEHKVELDSSTGLVAEPDSAPEEWTKLEFNKCSHCPLNSKNHPHCPVAKNLSAVAQAFKAEKSYEKVKTEVDTTERTYMKELPLQDGLFSLFGLIMATSACPHLDFLRPMARFHLPFSTIDETMVRSASFYLLKQYFVAQQGGKPDFDLKDFGKIYEKVNVVNQGISARIRSIAKADADINSVVCLDAFASILPSQASRKFSDITSMFN